MIFSNKLSPVEGKMLKDSISVVRINSEKKLGYGGLSGTIKKDGINPLLELRSLKKEPEIFRSSLNSNLQFEFKNIPEGPYHLMIIDDLDKVTGKKLELTKDLLRNCKRYVITARSEDNINRTLRNIMFKRKMKITKVQLSSKASVDATNILFAMFIVVLFVGGLPEVAMLVMAGRMITKGTK
jgi:hypothetical protein